MSDPFVGEIRAWALTYPPMDWAVCNGQSVSTAQFTALSAIIGTLYGSNSSTTFKLPDLRSSAPMAAGAPNPAWGMPNVPLASQLGSNVMNLTSDEMPAHTHQAVTAAVATASMTATPSATVYPSRPAMVGAAYSAWAPPPATDLMAGNVLTAAGGSQAHENRQPFLTLNFCIALYGMFPPRPQ